jgi:predicted permease
MTFIFKIAFTTAANSLDSFELFCIDLFVSPLIIVIAVILFGFWFGFWVLSRMLSKKSRKKEGEK